MIKREKGMPNLQKNILRNTSLKNYEKYALLIKSYKIRFLLIIRLNANIMKMDVRIFLNMIN